MKNILVLNASLTSNTKKLFELRNKEWIRRYPDAKFKLTEIDLNEEVNSLLSSKNLNEDFYLQGNNLLDKIIEYDEVIILASMINYSIPATLKSFVDLITIQGRTFTFENGELGYPMANELPETHLVFSSGSSVDFLPTVIQQTPFAFLESLKLNGFKNLYYVWADGIDMPGMEGKSIEDKFEILKEKLMNPIKY